MAKKMDRGEPKKECPSCGLGVSLEANICEFCGWDFEEEDEWILQIEKLERDLLMEKQKFEPGTVNQRIEATLRSPVQEKVASAQAALTEPEERPKVEVVRASEYLIDRETPAPSRQPDEAPVQRLAPAPRPRPAPVEVVEAGPAKIRKVRNVRSPAPAPVPEQAPEQEPIPEPVVERHVEQPPMPLRTVKQPAPTQTELPPKKVRTVRKVKG